MFEYCNLVWGMSNARNGLRLSRLQKAAARIILNSTFDDRSEDLLKMLNWSPLEKRLKCKRMTMVYKSLNGLAPQYLANMFRHTNDIHCHSLRSTTCNNLFLEGGSTQFHNKTFSYVAAKEWNELSMQCKNANSLSSFKRYIQDFY